MTERLEIFTTLLKTMPPGRLLDLACGHGAFAMAANELGWDVTAVDVRTKRMPTKTPGITWVESDVRAFDIEGYDCISNLGLLYHLDLPAQIDLLKRCADTPMILDTHTALDANISEGGYDGVYFDELQGRTEEQWRNSGTASWDNQTSFWPTDESLHQMLIDCGFEYVWTLTPWYEDDRTFRLCL